MAHSEKAKVFMTGRSQAVRIPASFRFSSKEVFIRRDIQTGDVILSQSPGNWGEIFAALDAAGVPDQFLESGNRGLANDAPQEREELQG